MIKPSVVSLQSTIELPIVSETDSAFWTRLHAVLATMGGSITESSRAIGGAQELITSEISLPAGKLEVISETYIGVSLRGAHHLVRAVEDALRSL